MRNVTKILLIIGLLFIVIACQQKSVIEKDKIEVPIKEEQKTSVIRDEKQATSTVKISIGNVQAKKGADIIVPVTISDTTGLNVAGYEFTLLFDKNAISSSSVGIENTLSKYFIFAANTDVAGEIRVAAARASPLTGSGKLLDVKFNIKPDATSPISLKLLKLEVVDINGEEIISSASDGSIILTE